MDLFLQELDKTIALARAMRDDPVLAGTVAAIAGACTDSLRAGGTVLFCGNGGSAADSQHLAAELVGKLCFDRPGLAAIALTTDSSALTAIGNDYGFDRVFARQVEALGRPGDVLVGISTSGNSANVKAALATARERGLVTVGLTGGSGGTMAPLCDHLVVVPAGETQKIQEGHILIGHVVCALVESAIHG
ncbi:MAG: SIS domain-containing protein [Alphaproteobacteria bacterium]|jgi:D-sedoheptulose 7-phosphate isomerase|nr:SIS domain-containing protein [Alphaproteobacteria bacterium]